MPKKSPLADTAKKLSKQDKEPVKIAVNDDEDLGKSSEDITNATALMILLYYDTSDYNIGSVLGKLIDTCDKEHHTYAYVVHDKDVYKQNTYDKDHKIIGKKGDYKKTHIHFLVLFHDGHERNIKHFLPDGLTKQFVRVVSPNKETEATLYLSHIAHPDKHYYDYHLISTNNQSWVWGVHEDYKPYTVVDFVQRFLDGTDSYVSFTKLYRKLQDENAGQFAYYKNNYSIIRDMVNDHNSYVKSQITQSNIDDRVTVQSRILDKHSLDNIAKLVDMFGTEKIEINGQIYTITKLPEKNKKS